MEQLKKTMKNGRKPWKNWRKPWKPWRKPWKIEENHETIEENNGTIEENEKLKKTMQIMDKPMKTMENSPITSLNHIQRWTAHRYLWSRPATWESRRRCGWGTRPVVRNRGFLSLEMVRDSNCDNCVYYEIYLYIWICIYVYKYNHINNPPSNIKGT